MILDTELIAEIFHGREIHSVKAHINGYGAKLEFLWVKAAQITHCAEEGKRVLACGDTHGYFVAILYHIVVVHSASDEAEDSFYILHKVYPIQKKVCRIFFAPRLRAL